MNTALSSFEKYPMCYEHMKPQHIRVGKKLYVIGGSTVKCEFYDEEWFPIQDLKISRDRHQILHIGNMILVCGGSSDLRTEIYNIDTNIWQFGAPMVSERYNFGLTSIGGCVIAIGGMDSSGKSHRTCEYYSSNGWTLGPEMLSQQDSFVMLNFMDGIYVIGGLCDGDTTGVVQKLCVTPVGLRWSIVSCLITPRVGHYGFVSRNTIVVTGGASSLRRDSNQSIIGSTEIFDGNEWKYGNPLNVPRYDASGEGPVIVGGYARDRIAIEIEKYSSDEWSIYGSVQIPRVGCIYSNGLICSGISEEHLKPTVLTESFPSIRIDIEYMCMTRHKIKVKGTFYPALSQPVVTFEWPDGIRTRPEVKTNNGVFKADTRCLDTNVKVTVAIGLIVVGGILKFI